MIKTVTTEHETPRAGLLLRLGPCMTTLVAGSWGHRYHFHSLPSPEAPHQFHLSKNALGLLEGSRMHGRAGNEVGSEGASAGTDFCQTAGQTLHSPVMLLLPVN